MKCACVRNGDQKKTAEGHSKSMLCKVICKAHLFTNVLADVLCLETHQIVVE